MPENHPDAIKLYFQIVQNTRRPIATFSPKLPCGFCPAPEATPGNFCRKKTPGDDPGGFISRLFAVHSGPRKKRVVRNPDAKNGGALFTSQAHTFFNP
jgi:hypothetical protein